MNIQDTEGNIIQLTNTSDSIARSDQVDIVAGFAGAWAANVRPGSKGPFVVRAVLMPSITTAGGAGGAIAEGDSISYDSVAKKLVKTPANPAATVKPWGKAIDALAAGKTAQIRVRLISQ